MTDDKWDDEPESGIIASPPPLRFPLNLLMSMLERSYDFVDYIRGEDRLKPGLYRAWHLTIDGKRKYGESYVAIMPFTRTQVSVLQLQRNDNGSYSPIGPLQVADKSASRRAYLQQMKPASPSSVWDRIGKLEKIVIQS